MVVHPRFTMSFVGHSIFSIFNHESTACFDSSVSWIRWQLLNRKNYPARDRLSRTYPGLLGPEGLKFPGLMRLAVSGFMSRGLCGPTEDMDMLLLSRLSPETDKFYVSKKTRKKKIYVYSSFVSMKIYLHVYKILFLIHKCKMYISICKGNFVRWTSSNLKKKHFFCHCKNIFLYTYYWYTVRWTFQRNCTIIEQF